MCWPLDQSFIRKILAKILLNQSSWKMLKSMEIFAEFYANFGVTISNGLSSKVFGRKICPWQYVRTEEGQPISSLRQYKYVACQITWQQSGRVLTEAECVQWKRCRKTLSKQKSIGSFSLSCELCQLQPFNGIFPLRLYTMPIFSGVYIFDAICSWQEV